MSEVKRLTVEHKAASYAPITENTITNGVLTGTFKSMALISSDIKVTIAEGSQTSTEGTQSIKKIVGVEGTQTYASFSKEDEKDIFGFEVDEAGKIHINEKSMSKPVQFRVVNLMSDGSYQGMTFSTVQLSKESLLNTKTADADETSVEFGEISINFKGSKDLKTGDFCVIEDLEEADIAKFLGLE